MPRPSPRVVASLFALVSCASAVEVEAAVLFNLTDLGSGYAYGINSKGQVSTDRSIWDPVAGHRAHRWEAAWDINDAGTAVGLPKILQPPETYSYPTNTYTPINRGPGVQSISGRSVNELGQAAITIDFTNGGQHPGRLVNGSVIDFGYQGGAFDINDFGVVAGTYSIGAFPGQPEHFHAFTHAAARSDLHPLQFSDSMATAINNRGQVAVVAHNGDGNWHSFLHDKGVRLDLPQPPRLFTTDINNFGSMVGYSQYGDDTQAYGYLYTDGVWRDLNTMIDPALGYTMAQARAINDKGQIVGFATQSGGAIRAVLLTPVVPVPPAAYAGGAILVALVVARVRRASLRRATAATH
jgi:probable HAF family extracellular repeat protein